MKVKSEFIHEVITHNAKITPKYFYWCKLIEANKEPHKEVWEVKRTINENIYCRADLKFLIEDEDLIEKLGYYNYHGQKY